MSAIVDVSLAVNHLLTLLREPYPNATEPGRDRQSYEKAARRNARAAFFGLVRHHFQAK
jgi:hypothetical protein